MTKDLLDAASSNPWEGGVTFSLRNRIYRTIWSLTWLIFARWTPPHLRVWRLWLLRCFGARVAPTANVYGSASIWSPENLELGQYAAVGPGVRLYTMANVKIGDYAIVSQRAHLCAGTHDVEDKHFQLKSRPICIGPRAWIAAEAFVGPGVTVGEGAVLGARGCAMKDLEPWMIYSGNPAHPLRIRRIRFSGSTS